MAPRISSRSNATIQRVRRLNTDAAFRRSEGALIAEGVRLIEEAVAAASEAEHLLVSPRLTVSEKGRSLKALLEEKGLPLIETTDGVLDSISDAETSQGILGVFRSPALTTMPRAASPIEFWVVAWGLQDPGNVGTLMRTADAAGADLFVTIAGTADPVSPKAVRASAGSVFRLPLVRGIPPGQLLDEAHARGVRLFGTDPADGVPYFDGDYGGPIGFAFGREGEGLPPAVTERLHRTVTIPMRAGVESLNVAAAAAVVLFEAARRRTRV